MGLNARALGAAARGPSTNETERSRPLASTPPPAAAASPSAASRPGGASPPSAPSLCARRWLPERERSRSAAYSIPCSATKASKLLVESGALRDASAPCAPLGAPAGAGLCERDTPSAPASGAHSADLSGSATALLLPSRLLRCTSLCSLTMAWYSARLGAWPSASS